MSIEENSAETQGVKVYRVNEEAIKAMDFARFHDLCAMIGFYPNNAEAQGIVADGFSSTGHEYEVHFEPGQILVVLDEDEEFCSKPGSEAFALAITYGIYEEVK